MADDSIGGAAAGIRGSNATAHESIAALQSAISTLEQALGQLRSACEGTPQADATEAEGVYSLAFDTIRESQRTVAAAIKAAEGVAARL